MTDVHSLFALDTGELTGFRLGGSDADRAANTPPGHGWIAGALDPRRNTVRQMVDDFGDAFPSAVARTPPRPSDGAYFTWTWSEAAADWISAPTAAARAHAARAERSRLLAACDWVAARALETGEPVPAAWRDYRAALRDVPEQAGFPDAITWPTPPQP